uniref:hypothetical protein n=1 Tax=Serratia marcescens TaxID=615 RepID=UPI0011E626A0
MPIIFFIYFSKLKNKGSGFSPERKEIFVATEQGLKKTTALAVVFGAQKTGLLQQAGNHPGHAVGLLEHGDTGL